MLPLSVQSQLRDGPVVAYIDREPEEDLLGAELHEN